MTTAKNDVFIGLKLEFFYVVGEGEIDFWWGENRNFFGGIFPVGGGGGG